MKREWAWSERGKAGRWLVLTAALLAQGALGATCVDGLTPDCSDAATACGPDLDGSADRSDASVVVPEASPIDTGIPDVDVDAGVDADLDAGDEG